MDERLLTPPPPGVQFTAGSLPRSPLAKAVGIRSLFGSCGAEAEDHHAWVESGTNWLLLATLGGGGIVRAEAQTYEAAPTTLLLVPPSVQFEEQSAGHGAWAWILLRLRLAKGNPLFSPSMIQPWLGRPGLPFFQLMSEIVACLYARPDGFECESVARLIELLGALGRLISAGDRPPPAAFIEQVCSLMRQDLGRSWPVAELAQHCHMSGSSFAHRFKEETGTTPKQWLTKERMREARSLLADRRSIDDIADRLGYSSRYHFTQVFTRTEGIPPGRFQRLATRR